MYDLFLVIKLQLIEIASSYELYLNSFGCFITQYFLNKEILKSHSQSMKIDDRSNTTKVSTETNLFVMIMK